jgi:hypothetical protein
MNKTPVIPLLTILLVFFAGCATYIPPGEKADLKGLAPADVQEGFSMKPASPFPAGIAALRVQGPQYSNYNLDHNGGRSGTGRYSVISVHEVEEQSQIDRITRLPMVAGMISINRMLLPSRLDSDRDLRIAASRLQADLLLLYTFDTAFFDTDSARPLTVISLGLSPTRKIRVTTTASALLLDTRTGFIYSAYETTERRDVRATSWGSRDSADEARRDAERTAFAKLVDELVGSWPGLLERYAKKGEQHTEWFPGAAPPPSQ